MQKRLNHTAQEIYQPVKAIIYDKNFKKYFIALIILYLMGYASILIADAHYVDDFRRARTGKPGWLDFSRHISYYFSHILHMGRKLSDISPLTQLIAVLILSASSMFLVKITNERLRFMPIIASACIGLSPYFLENFSFKFDSPYMAFSVLSSIIPFLWYRSKKKYFVVFSVLGVLGTMISYQASSGIYPIIFIALLAKDFLSKRTTLRQNVNNMIYAVFSYGLALLIFRYVFFTRHTNYGYTATTILEPSAMADGVIRNLVQYFSLIKEDLFSGFIGYALLFLCGLYLVKLLLLSKRNIPMTVFVSVISLTAMGLLMWGGYIVLKKPLLYPRAFVGVGVLVAILALLEVEKNKFLQRINYFFIGVFMYALIAFANSYGNALQAQDKYETFRLTILMNDLSRFIPNEKEGTAEIIIRKQLVPYSKVVDNAAYHYPLIKRLIRSEIYSTKQHFRHLYQYKRKKEIKKLKLCDETKIKSLDTLVNTAFHTIEKATYSDCYFVTFK